MSSFVLCVRDKVSGEDEFGIDIGSVSYLQVPDEINIPAPSHKIGMKQWLDAIVAQAYPNQGALEKKLDIIFFVHGYNIDPEEALKRQRLVEQELRKRNYQCMVIGFDWPSGGNALLYEYDRFQALDAASLLVKGGIIPFTKYSTKDCPVNVHVMAHSMGGFVVREAFRYYKKGRDADLANDWRIGQLVLFAADLSSECFTLHNSDMLPVFNHSGRLTNYFSGYDAALAVSNVKNIDIYSRVGRVGMPIDTPAHEKALDVDCGQRYFAKYTNVEKLTKVDGMVSHSWYMEDEVWYEDLAYTLKGDIDRNLIPTRTYVEANDFILKTEV